MFAEGGGTDVPSQPWKEYLMSRQTPCVSPAPSGAGEGNTLTEHVPHGKKVCRSLLTDIFQEQMFSGLQILFLQQEHLNH